MKQNTIRKKIFLTEIFIEDIKKPFFLSQISVGLLLFDWGNRRQNTVPILVFYKEKISGMSFLR